MREAGADTTLVHLAALELRPCLGCYTCWVATPGECVHRDRDGMASIMSAWREADVVVFGTPLHHFSMSALMKTFLDRLLPELEPWLIADPEAPEWTTHPARHRGPGRALLVSPCGFPDADQFGPLVDTFRYIAGRHHWTWLGEILRTAAEPLARGVLATVFEPYLTDVRRAGAALIREGRIPDPSREALGRELLPGGRDAFRDRANQSWRELIERHQRRGDAARPSPGVNGLAGAND